MFSVSEPKGEDRKQVRAVEGIPMSFRKITPLAKPAPKQELHKKPAAKKPAKPAHKPHRRPVGDRD
jgi:hypothetical protein